MPKTTAFAALTAAALALSLAACSTPAPSPSDEPEPTPTADVPVGTGDFTPDADWFAALDVAIADFTYYVESWDNQSCDMDKVIGGDFNCTIHISGIQGGIGDLAPLLADVVDVTPESAEQVADLVDAAALAPAADEARAAYTDQVCDFSPDEACVEPGDAMVAAGKELQAALAGWVPPAG